MFPARLLLFSKGIPPPRDVPSIKHQRRTPLFYAVSRPIERRFATLQNSRRAFRLSPPLLCMLSPFLFFHDHGFILDSLENRSSWRASPLGGKRRVEERKMLTTKNVNAWRGEEIFYISGIFSTTLTTLQRLQTRVDFDSAAPLENLSIPTVLENAVSDPRAWISRRLVKLWSQEVERSWNWKQ